MAFFYKKTKTTMLNIIHNKKNIYQFKTNKQLESSLRSGHEPRLAI